MADVRPFRALRPRNDLAAAIIAPPYDVMSDAQARSIANDPRSFVRITRPEVDLELGADAHSDLAYTTAATNLKQFEADGLLVQDKSPTYYFYGQVMGDHDQVGIIAGASVEEYDRGIIKKHEHTRPDKEDDRTHHMEVLDAQVGLVFLTFRADPKLAELTSTVTAGEPEWRVTTPDGVRHTLWVAPNHLVPLIQSAFARLDALYIADGHHRSAAASRVHAHRHSSETSHFLAGLFPDDNLHVMAYNRVVDDIGSYTPESFMSEVKDRFDVERGPSIPTARGRISMYFGGTWYSLTPKAGTVNTNDPVARLDVSVLQDQILAPLLGVSDPRTSTNIRFVGGINGPSALERAVDAGAAVAFHLYPTGLDQLFEVADDNQVMPPKSTWFEPKLREGVAIRLIRE